ncbi:MULTISPECIES: DUF7344 domain-containing protein [Halorussus]|uniref:DUF7344 domain-containing protein n=1 Tax=Halorussus TaxID=1070314 RepID=UPI00209EBA8B|nr:hypothetical protein [Halorussus vallis]USZ74886.1 hypothetical protein NGM07_15775 [Halorussus vallis]
METEFEMGTRTDSASIDAALDALADRRRRSLLAFVADRPSPTSLDALVEHVADRDRSEVPTAGRLGTDARERAEISLVHCHLPKLDATDVLDYDRDARTVEPGENFLHVEPFLGVDEV